MPIVTPCFCVGGNVARIVDARLDLRQPLRGEVSLQFETGRRGEGHGDRAAVAGLDLRVHVGARGARHMRALARIGPGRRMKPVLDRGLHQRMVGGMEADEIDAPPVAIVGVELGRVLVRERPELQKLGRPGAGPEGFRAHRSAQPAPSRATASFSAASESKRLVVGEFDRLVEHLVGDGAVWIERRAEIVLSVASAFMGPSPFSMTVLRPAEIGKDVGALSPRIEGRVNRRPCPPPRSTLA